MLFLPFFLLLWQGCCSAQSITGFTLFDATSNAPIGDLGDTIDASIDLDLNIRADFVGNVNAVEFELDGAFHAREGAAPFMLGGDRDGDVFDEPALRLVGPHTLKATAFDGSGAAVDSKTVTFTTINPSLGIDSSADVAVLAPADNSTDVPAYNSSNTGALNGELRKWHKITIGFQGPETSETAIPNPFADYRLDVNFTSHTTNVSYIVPGYYAADGNAANTGTDSGNVWLVHFAPDQVGNWTYLASFVEGNGVAVGGNNGTSAGYFHGATGQFFVNVTDKSGRDHRGKGRLQYVGKHHLQFAETGEYFLKAGADSPENFLNYQDFDNTPSDSSLRKDWAAHLIDYKAGDPTWMGGKGRAIVGAVSYLAGKGMNVFSFLPMNLEGDDKNVFPYISKSFQDFDRFDVSKLSQWEVVFTKADSLGMFLHFKTQETENDQLLDGGSLGYHRKLYYRELVARFSHHLALNWNIGEENTNTDEQRKAFIDYFKEVDPYDHPVVMHTYPGTQEENYGPLLGYATFDGVSIQTGLDSGFSQTKLWVEKSAAIGRKWVVAYDEQGPADDGVVPDLVDPQHDPVRKNVLWANIMAGGAGVEYYFGYKHRDSDLSCQDFRSRDKMWDQSRYALEFFSNHSVPFWDMNNMNERLVNDNVNWLLATRDGKTVVAYLRNGGSAVINLLGLSEGASSYSIRWYDPRSGGSLQNGTVSSVPAGSAMSIGNAQSSGTQDWVVLLRCEGCETSPSPTNNMTTPSIEPVDLVSVRINCGGDDFVDLNGNIWQADNSFEGGEAFEIESGIPIAQTSDEHLYRSERNRPTLEGPFRYTIKLNGTGRVEVNLLFAEIFFTQPGERVFDVSLGGTPVLTDFDVVKEAGPLTAFKKTFSADINDGEVVIEFSTKVERPKISAIEVFYDQSP